MFILFTYPRTGSSHLVRLIDSHPNCVCIGEALKPDPYTIAHPNLSFLEFLFQRYGKSPLPVFVIKNLYKLIWRLNSEKLSLCPDNIGEHLVDSYAYWLGEMNQGYKYGIKIHIEHLIAFPSAKKLLSNSKVIILKRSNILKCYISLLRANQTKVFATSKRISKKPIRIDTEFLLRDLTQIKNNMEYLNTVCSDLSNIFQITYENMIDNWNSVKNELMDFLDLKIENVNLVSPFKRIAFGKVENDIQNFNEVKYALKNTEYEAFLNP